MASSARAKILYILGPGSVFKDYHLHHVQSLEEKLEDLASLSLNYWLTKFAQEVANKNEIVNSARGMFTEFRNAFELHCKRKCKQQTIEVIKLCLSCVLLFLIDFQTHVFGYPNTLFFTEVSRGIHVT